MCYCFILAVTKMCGTDTPHALTTAWSVKMYVPDTPHALTTAWSVKMYGTDTPHASRLLGVLGCTELMPLC